MYICLCLKKNKQTPRNFHIKAFQKYWNRCYMLPKFALLDDYFIQFIGQNVQSWLKPWVSPVRTAFVVKKKN